MDITSLGDSADFGDMTAAQYGLGGVMSTTRGCFGGGENSPSIFIDYITMASTGNAADFGDTTQARNGIAGCSSHTRGCFGGGRSPTLRNTIDYITIAST